MTNKRNQTTKNGDIGENLVAVAMDSIGATYRKQPQKTGRGHKWKPDFAVKRQGEEWSDAAFIEVKTQYQYGSADVKIAGQALRAARMGLHGYFVLITHAHRDMFSQDTLSDTQWMLEKIGADIKIIMGTEALIEELQSKGYGSLTPNTYSYIHRKQMEAGYVHFR
ncbi:putative endodeoxyribonuclease I [Arthronema virus TR020]|uniref:Putative endodeoxyribonuclease I n=1 Tax=Arthronema virus TR020 TaxID=2736280 RepID=A0A7G3WH26_9CAUD|nr:putative endodeoxyribonuclease I [Arthronema virus TR020]